jgi:curli biogenesis system outer membrane secretion channel CsgG
MAKALLKRRINSCFLLFSLFLTVFVFLNGCQTTLSETAEQDPKTRNVGDYPAPPAGIGRIRVGVPPFRIENAQLPSVKALESLAAVQLTTLAVQTKRFKVIEGVQQPQPFKEQDLEGTAKPGKLAVSEQVRSVDYLLVGKVTNFRVKAAKSKNKYALGSIYDIVRGKADVTTNFDFNSDKSEIDVECGVDLRLANTVTGEVIAAGSCDFKRTDTVGAMGIGVEGWYDQENSELSIDADNQGKILRLALDAAIRKMLPEVDEYLISQQSASKTKES